MGKYDIVYILKEDVQPLELRYSLRSLKNFPHKNVWFYCGRPEGIKPDCYAHIRQKGVSVWSKVRSSIEQVCLNEQITKDFWLFNDDFFVMKPVENLEPIYNGTLQQRIEEIENRVGESMYSRQLKKLRELLIENGYQTYNYAVHVPMLINRRNALKVLRNYDSPMFRSLYGNVMNIGGANQKDVKIFRIEDEPQDTTFLSTTESSFEFGKVGTYIQNAFPDKCEYEE